MQINLFLEQEALFYNLQAPKKGTTIALLFLLYMTTWFYYSFIEASFPNCDLPLQMSFFMAY